MAEKEQIKGVTVGIFTKIILGVFFVILVIFIAGGYYISLQLSNILKDQLLEKGKLFINLNQAICQDAISGKDDILLMTYITRLKSGPEVAYALVLNPDSKVIMHTDMHELGKSYRDALTIRAVTSNDLLIQETTLPEGESIYEFSAPLLLDTKRVGTLKIALSSTEMESLLAEFRNNAMVAGLAMAILIILGVFVVIFNYSRGLDQLKTMGEALLSGKTLIKMPEDRNDEIGYLARTLRKVMENMSRLRKEAADDKTYIKLRYELLIKNLAQDFKDGLIVLDQDSKIIYLNETVSRLFQIPVKNAYGRHILEVNKDVELMEVISSSQTKPNQPVTHEMKGLRCAITALTMIDPAKREPVGTIIKVIA